MLISLRRSPYRALEKRLGYAFKNHKLLEVALTHRSFRFEQREVTEDNQRMEFLGDAVLGLVTAAHIYREFKEVDEGHLTELRSRVASGRALATIAKSMDLGAHIRLGKGEEQAGGRDRPGVLADCLEAVIAAAYLDGGLKAVDKVFAAHFAPLLAGGDIAWTDNPKGHLQEIVQRLHKENVQYRCVSEEGPAHQKRFTVEAVVRGVAMGVGRGPNRRAAETEAAMQALQVLKAGRP